MEVRSATDTLHRNATSPISTKKNGIIHKVDFSNTFLSIFVGKQPFGHSK